MRPLFDRYEVKVVGLSKDTVEDANKQRIRDGLSFTLLADPELKVIEEFGLIHQNGLEFGTFFFLGFPLGWPTGFRRMAIPTTLLVDRDGTVRWIDQAEDYRLRGDAERIQQALQTVFGVEEDEE